MAQPTSPHLANIPQAIRFAGDTTVDPGLKQQAIDYLRQVNEACDETWQVRFPFAFCLRGHTMKAGDSEVGRGGRALHSFVFLHRLFLFAAQPRRSSHSAVA